ncbi:probable phospholipid-transporting atpase ih [Stylonychia lemnae]|uniref:Probable phospholipid-transporting atpase ih n=1 Tax=Stylonychia lemnae TaxID=5949 RepID=A0A078AGR8_STYLE|nr:probable phospholipid-transporting atpase ih [Stylonychia lemnae]|eukprot:CDW80053.1 probable phospholipid-transporting atpase ih [Stylonychia lemnae]
MYSIIPLAFVVFLGMIRELIADVKRWKKDKETNNRIFNLVRKEQVVQVKSQDLRVGDIIELHDDQIVPADCVLLSSSDNNGQCFVQTSSLDGEKNLKPKLAIKFIQDNVNRIIKEDVQLLLIYNQPSRALYEFDGTIETNEIGQESKISKNLDFKQFIHAGSTIKNSNKILAIIIYTGNQTKLFLNQGSYHYKQSLIEKQLNIILFINLFIILGVSAIMAGRLFSSVRDEGKSLKYIFPEENPDPTFYAGTGFASFYILMNSFIPLSLVITLEISKLWYSKFIEDDAEMITIVDDGASIDSCRVQNMTIHEELGNINYILCDKTGTLTQNELVFKAFATNQLVFEGIIEEILSKSQSFKNSEDYLNFWRCLCLCHDAISIQKNDLYSISSASLDEQILLQMSSSSNFARFLKKDSDTMTIQLQDKEEIYDVLKVFEFDSTRKMMSVIVKNVQSQKIYLFSKGADMAILPILKFEKSSEDIHKETLSNINKYAKQGFRILVFGYREIEESQLQSILRGKLNSQQVECGLSLLGITAVEDLLQENVTQCIQDFKEANINVLMLTGDKGETAEQVGYSCGLFKVGQKIIKLDDMELNKVQIGGQVDLIKDNKDLENTVFMVSGNKIAELFSGSQNNQKQLKTIFESCKAGILFRLSPGQKAQVASFIKSQINGAVTLAVGDGANDVNMIQQAHVGVGIFGKEGNQAAQFSDYAIPQFKHLRRLLFWHGRTYALRFSNFTKWFIWKNSIFSIILLYHSFDTKYSAGNLVPDFFYAVYDVLFTNLAILMYCIIDQDVDYKFTNKEDQLKFKLSNYYNHTRERVVKTTIRQYWIWLIYIFIASLPIYYVTQYSYNHAIVTSDGKTDGLMTIGFAITTSMVTAHHIMITIATRNWTFFAVILYILSFLAFMPLGIIVEDNIPANSLYATAFTDGMIQPQQWLTIIITSAMVVFPYYIVYNIWHLILYSKYNY